MQKIRLDSVRPTNPDDPQSALYGLGIAKMGPMYGHTGELPGFNSFMGSDPVNKVTLIVWTNLAPAADGRDPATTIARALLGQIYATPQYFLSAALLQAARHIAREIGENAVGAGPLEGEQAFRNGALRVKPAILDGRHDHRIFARHLIGEGRHVKGLLQSPRECRDRAGRA